MKRALFFVSAAFGATAALAQAPNAQMCAGCHGAQGEGNAQAGGPRIAGQPQRYLERQLEAYAQGKRQSAAMAPIAKSLPENERSALAAHFANLNPAHKPQSASAGSSTAASTRARALATHGDEAQRVQACQNCHGPDGAGLGEVNPYLAGLDAKYLQNALSEWKRGARDTDPSGQMQRIGKSLSDSDVQALASYYASLPAPLRAAAGAKPPAQAATPTHPEAGSKRRQGAGVGGTEPATSGGSQGPGGGQGAGPGEGASPGR